MKWEKTRINETTWEEMRLDETWPKELKSKEKMRGDYMRENEIR